MSVEISKDQSGAQQKIIPITERMKTDMVSRGTPP